VDRQITNHLRLYTEPPDALQTTELASVPALADVCRAFERATGWRLRFVSGEQPRHDADPLWSAPVDPGVGVSPGHLRIDVAETDVAADATPVEMERAIELASAVARMLRDFWRTRHALWQREAELAAGVPLAVRRDQSQPLAQRLEAVLKGVADVLGCQSAGIYLLDAATTELKLRSAWGLPLERFTAPARPLGTATADLEALAGHAVVLEDPKSAFEWNPPERFPAAVCVPISSATVPLGTLWIYSSMARAFSDVEVNIAEIVAGRLASDLEREMLLAEGVEAAQLKRQLAEAQRLHQSQTQRVAPLIDGWDVAARTWPGSPLGGDFYEWFVQPDTTLSVALGDSVEQGLAAAMFAGAGRAAVRAWCETTPQPHLLLAGVNRTLWSTSAGDQVASLFCGWIDTAAGRLRYATAGHPGVILLRPGSWESLTLPALELGREPNTEYEPQQRQLQPGDVLLVVSGGVRDARDGDGRPMGERALAESMLAYIDRPADELLQIARAQMQADPTASSARDRSVVVVKRKSRL
jgi:phosphoserine phosphatase RsbU/P